MVVLSSAKIGTASWRYYADAVACRAADYYAGVGEAPGRWHGRGLEALGLTERAEVSARMLEATFGRALHPDSGEQLGRAWRADGVTGFDLTFSAPKSVSAVWALGDERTASAAVAAHRAAVKAGLAYLDSHAALSRRGTDGTEQVCTDGLAVALFDHRTSRAGDPQLHTHALVLNKVRCTDGRWRTLDASELFHHKKSAGMIYQAALRNELHRRLGISFAEPNAHGQAEIAGMPTELRKLWSKRTAAIDVEATPKIAEYEHLLGRALTDRERVKVVKTAVLKTRPGRTTPALSALHETWAVEADSVGWTPQRLQRCLREATGHEQPAPEQPQPTDPVLVDPVLVEAVRGAGLRRAVFSRADLAGEMAARLPTTGMTADEAAAQVEQLTDRALAVDETVCLGEIGRGPTARASDARYATVQVLEAEARILDLAAGGRGGGYGQVRPGDVFACARSAGLDPGQHTALLRLAAAGDQLAVLTAPAGAGKTHTLGAATDAWTHAGFRVVGLAPSARAAAELSDATGGHTDTLAKWLHTQNRHEGGEMLRPDELAWARLDERTVLLVDEASMASTLDLDRLTTLAARNGAKVVLVGDPGQIGVINGPGGMLAALTHAGHGVELTEIHRFHAEWERAASLQLRAGDDQALPAYRDAGRLHPRPDGEQALDGVFAHWTAARAAGQGALMLARTREDVDALNSRARAAALEQGQVQGPVLSAGGRDWQAGDLLRARRNDRQLGIGDSHVRNGDRYRVLGPSPDGGLAVEDLAGRGRTTLPAAYLAEHADYGWASTIDSAQGATTDIGIVLVRPGIDREHLYVALTRGRLANHAYITPDPLAADNDQHHQPPTRQHRPGPAAQPDPAGSAQLAAMADAVAVLSAALEQSGAQDAAHTALEKARSTAADRHTRAERQHRPADRQTPPTQAGDRPVPEHHRVAVDQLRQLREHSDLLRQQRAEQQQTERAARDELATCPRWARGRRRDLTETINAHQAALQQGKPAQTRLADDIDRLTRVVEQHTRERTAQFADEQHRETLRANIRATFPEPLTPFDPTTAPGHDTETLSGLSQRPSTPIHQQDRDSGRGR